MTTKEVLLKYHKLVPFPLTPRKIKKAGFEPFQFFIELGADLAKASDLNSPTALEVIDTIRQLEFIKYGRSK